jgi:hypothetical protein
MQQEGLLNDGDAFRKMFKYYKQRQPAPALSSVVDFRDESSFGKHVCSSEVVLCLFHAVKNVFCVGNQTTIFLLYFT